MMACPAPITTGPTCIDVNNGARVLLAADARKLKAPPLSVIGAEVETRPARLTAVVLELPLLSRLSVPPGLTRKPEVVMAVPAARIARVPALTTVLPV